MSPTTYRTAAARCGNRLGALRAEMNVQRLQRTDRCLHGGVQRGKPIDARQLRGRRERPLRQDRQAAGVTIEGPPSHAFFSEGVSVDIYPLARV